MAQILDSNGQIAKLDTANNIADDASRSADIDRQLGAFLLYAGFVDFLAIQAARLLEQIILKKQLSEGGIPIFQPHSDSYFYDNRVSTRRILKIIRSYLPFSSTDPNEAEKVNQINKLTKKMIKLGNKFLNYRNPIVHHIGNPTMTFEDIVTICDKARDTYKDFVNAHTAFMMAAQSYGFSEKEFANLRELEKMAGLHSQK